MSAEIIMLKDYRKAKEPAKPTVFAIGDGLFTYDKPFEFTSPVRTGERTFTDAELCELHDWIFGKPPRSGK